MQYNKFKLYTYLCVGAFFLILAFTLLYSFGYKYDFDTGESFQTGAIVLKAVPTDVIITKDGEEVKQSGFLNGIWSTFVKIENLASKSYDIRVAKEGYNEWQKDITINGGQVGKFESIVLLKKEYTEKPVMEDVVLADQKNIWFHAEKNMTLVYGTLDAAEGLYLLDLANEEQKIVLDKDQLALMGKIQNIEWTGDDNKIIVKTENDLYVVDLRDGGKAYLISNEIEKVLKQAGAVYYVYGDYIIYGQDGSVYSFNFVTKATKKIIDAIASFYVYEGGLYLFRAEDPASASLHYLGLGDYVRETVISVMPEGYDARNTFTLQKQGDNAIVISGGSLYLVSNDAGTVKLNSNVKEAKFFQNGKRILYSNDNEIWVYYVEDKLSQPTKNRGENELLSRFSGKLSNIYLYSDEEHLFYQENGVLSFTELDGRDNRNTFKLLQNPEGQDLFYVWNKGFIYFVKENRLYKIDLKEV